MLKSLSDTRLEVHAVAIEAILMFYLEFMEALEQLQEYYSQKGGTRREAENIANKMHELEFASMLIFFEKIMKHVHSVSQALQNEHANLKSCADLNSLLADHFHASRNESKRFEEAVKEIISGVDYKATLTLKRKRKKVVNDGYAPGVSMNARDKFCVPAF